MTPYETLGVPRDATADDIKQAFRRRSSQCHPDKGGDAEEMAAVNRAYEVLGNPARRAEFDETGASAEPGSIDVEARDALITLFRTSLEGDGDHVADVSAMLQAHKAGLLGHQAAVEAARKRLLKRRKRIRAKTGENLIHGLIDAKIAEFDLALAKLPRGLDVNRRATEMLSNYEMTGEGADQFLPAWTYTVTT